MIRRRKIFILLEVLFVLSIISVFSLFIVRSFSSIVSSLSTIKNYTQALFLIQREVFNLSQSELKNLEEKGKLREPFHRFFWVREVKRATEENIFKVRASLEWKEGLRKKEFTIFTYLKER